MGRQAIYPRPEDSTTAWFAVLERARITRDHDLAEKAQRQLDRLGVTVTFSEAASPVQEFVRRITEDEQ